MWDTWRLCCMRTPSQRLMRPDLLSIPWSVLVTVEETSNYRGIMMEIKMTMVVVGWIMKFMFTGYDRIVRACSRRSGRRFYSLDHQHIGWTFLTPRGYHMFTSPVQVIVNCNTYVDKTPTHTISSTTSGSYYVCLAITSSVVWSQSFGKNIGNSSTESVQQN